MTTKEKNNLTTEQEKSIALLQHLQIDHFVCDDKVYEGDFDNIENEYNEWLEEDESNADRTFEEYVAHNCTEVEDYADYCTLDGSSKEFLVLDDNEAQDRFVQCLQDYIDDCIMPTIPESLRYYFDDEKWIKDAEIDGRGHTIASYDGCENEVIVDGETFYIYRIN